MPPPPPPPPPPQVAQVVWVKNSKRRATAIERASCVFMARDYNRRVIPDRKLNGLSGSPELSFSLRDLCDLGVSAVNKTFNSLTAETQRTQRTQRVRREF